MNQMLSECRLWILFFGWAWQMSGLPGCLWLRFAIVNMALTNGLIRDLSDTS